MRVMRAIGLAVALLALAAPIAHAGPVGPLGQNGRWITDGRGRVLIFHGVNMVNKIRAQGYRPSATGFGDDDARFLQDNGLNGVRLGVLHAGVEPTPGHYNDAYLADIARTVNILGRHGIFVLLDFHQDLFHEDYQGEGFPTWAKHDDGLPAVPKNGFPANYVTMPALNRTFDHFWANDPGAGPPPDLGGVGVQDRYAAAWRHVALRFRGYRNLLGYDLLNEPWPGSVYSSCANPNGCPAFDQNMLTPFSRRVTNRIRQVDRRTIDFYEPNVFFDFGAKTSHGDTGSPAGMSFHDYCLGEIGSGGANPLDPAQAAGCPTEEDLPFTNANEQSARTHDALLMTEFGATDDLPQIDRVARRADKYMVGWLYWAYCTCNDPTGSATEGVVKNPAKPPTGSNVKGSKLRVVSRPYPQAVAGRPTDFDYNPASKAFKLDYTTARLGGGRFAFGADTEVFMPRLHYPRGYDVVLQGGDTVSDANARTLRVRTCPGRRRVRLRVAPGQGRVLVDCRAPGAHGSRKAFRIRLKVRPRHVRALRRKRRFRFRATIRLGHKRIPVRRARIRFRHRTKRTNRRGRARIRVRLRRAGRYRAKATKRGLKPGRATVRACRRPHRHSHHWCRHRHRRHRRG